MVKNAYKKVSKHFSSISVLLTSYLQLSLRTHPDKNPNDPSATQQFQKISEAYRVLLKHLDNNSDSDDSDHDGYVDEKYLYELYRYSSQAVQKLLKLLKHRFFLSSDNYLKWSCEAKSMRSAHVRHFLMFDLAS